MPPNPPNGTPEIELIHLDVFCKAAFYGNPLAVIVLDEHAAWPELASMQRVANWLNLSETTFARPHASGKSYDLRIFTPTRELPFAGHPSLGTAAALCAAGYLHGSEFTQHCAAGVLPVWRELADNELYTDAVWYVQAPTAQLHALSDAAVNTLEAICGLRYAADTVPAVIDNGPRWAVAQFSDAQALLAAIPDYAALSAWNQTHNNLGLAAFATERDAAGTLGLEVRCFVPLDGIPEDPVTGSGNAAIAAFLSAVSPDRQDVSGVSGFERLGLARNYQARQGRAMGRDGFVSMRCSAPTAPDSAAQVCVGGQVRIIARGVLLAELFVAESA
jgi:PhzF family phenazine biosynthesis protein